MVSDAPNAETRPRGAGSVADASVNVGGGHDCASGRVYGYGGVRLDRVNSYVRARDCDERGS